MKQVYVCKGCPWPHGLPASSPEASKHHLETGHRIQSFYVAERTNP